MKRKFLIAVLSVVFISIQYRIWFAKNGVVAMWRLKKAIAEQTEKNDIQSHRSDNLTAEILDLKSGGGAIEDHAREDFGMIKKDEVFYRTVPLSTAK